jgi:hypothetical protein
MTNLASTWNIGLAAWIIQDGSYPDFVAGETVELAVEYYQPPGIVAEVCEPDVSATFLADSSYTVVAEKILETDEITVADIGILVYQHGEAEPPMFERGSRVRTQLDLAVDPFYYFEGHSHSQNVPALIYTWRITSILQQTASYIETVAESGPFAGRKILTRDILQHGYEEILETDAWQDGGGAADYILRCDLLPIPPKRNSATAR